MSAVSSPATAPPVRRSGLGAWLRATLPTAAVFAVLIGLAMWGHSNGWSLPEWSGWLGSEATPAADWCQEHNVAESQCIECNAALLPPG